MKYTSLCSKISFAPFPSTFNWTKNYLQGVFFHKQLSLSIYKYDVHFYLFVTTIQAGKGD